MAKDDANNPMAGSAMGASGAMQGGLYGGSPVGPNQAAMAAKPKYVPPKAKRKPLKLPMPDFSNFEFKPVYTLIPVALLAVFWTLYQAGVTRTVYYSVAEMIEEFD